MTPNTGAMIAFFPQLNGAIAELSNIAHTAMPEHALPAEGMHLTIVYCGESADMSAETRLALKADLVNIAATISPIPASINGITRFVDSEPNSVVANFDAPGLAELRSTLIDALRMAGSEPVLDHGYTPHITVAYVPESQPMPMIELTAIPCLLDSITLALGEERVTYPLTGTRLLSEVKPIMDAETLTVLDTGAKPDEKPELVAEISLATPKFEFKGEFPDIPFAEGVDVKKLTEGDPNPLYVVRPLAILNEVSDANLEYDQELISEIRQQVHLKKPPARQGHIPTENISWEFPDDAGLWVGAEQIGPTLYGKAYIYPSTPFHQMVVKRKAAGSTLSNSIWGTGNWILKANGNKGLRGLNLESIDFAPAERASLGALGGAFGTTSEMKTTETEVEAVMADENKPDVVAQMQEALNTMEPSKVHEMLNPAQRRHCAEMCVKEMEPGSVYEMLPTGHRSALHEMWVKEFGTPAPAAEMSADVNKRIAEMQTAIKEQTRVIAEFKQKEFDGALNAAAASKFEAWNIKTDDGKKAIVSARENLKMYIVAEMAGMSGGAKLENIAAATEAAWPKYEPQASLLKTALSGGNVIIGNGTVAEQSSKSNGWNPQTGRYEEAVAADARAKVMGG